MRQSRLPRSICRREDNAMMNRWQKLALAAILSWVAALGGPGSATAQTKPEGEMRFALYVTLAPALLDPGEAVLGNLTPFWMLYALHDALVKPMPGNPMANSLAESWSMSEDQRVYEFTLRKGVKFHNDDPFTAEAVVFSFQRAKGAILKEKVKKVGADAFKAHPIGLGPYKFVSMKPGLELVMEANEDYWRKVPSVKRLVFQSVPEGSTRLAMLKAGEVDVAYLLEGQLGESIRNDPKLKLVFSGGIGTFFLDFFDMWDPKSPFADQRVRKAASLAIDRQALSDADTLGASKVNGNIVLKSMQFALPIDPDPYDPVQAKKLLAEAGYPNGFDAGDLTPVPPYFASGEAITGYLGAIGIKTKLRTMERAAFFAALNNKKLKGLCFCATAEYGNASTRMAVIVPSSGNLAYGAFPDIDELYKRQLTETNPPKREVMLHQIQKTRIERKRFAPIF